MPEIRLGTSGWSYKHWKDVFYPATLAQKHWFEYYTDIFDTVELNAPFYRVPGENAVSVWNAHSPERFAFSVKMNRQVTHIRKLQNCQNELDRFFAAFTELKQKISIILIQLPPNLSINPDRLDNFISILPTSYHYAFEFRNATWYSSEIFNILKNHNASFCIHDMHGLTTPRVITSDTVYIRFHGYDTMYGGNYPDSVLQNWAEWIRANYKEGKNIFGYFNNDIGGFAIKNCIRLKEMTNSIRTNI